MKRGVIIAVYMGIGITNAQVITIGGLYEDAGNSIIQTSDGGYAITGWTASFGAGLRDVYVVKLDGSGNLQWTRTIGGADWDDGHSIIQTSDGGYAIAGETESFGAGLEDIYVLKLDSNGNINTGNCGSIASGLGMVGSGGTTSSGGSISSPALGVVSDSGYVSSGGSVSVCTPLGIGNSHNGITTCSVALSGNTLRVDCSVPVKRIRLFSMDGREYFDVKLARDISEIDLSSIPKGTYWVEMLLEDETLNVTKVVKK